jgi:hypothetical protein
LAVLGWLLVVVGAVLPFVLVLGVPAVAAFLWWRRRGTPATASATTPPAAPPTAPAPE